MGSVCSARYHQDDKMMVKIFAYLEISNDFHSNKHYVGAVDCDVHLLNSPSNVYEMNSNFQAFQTL